MKHELPCLGIVSNVAAANGVFLYVVNSAGE
jgi:hypothetical protein